MRADERLQIEYAKFAKDCPKQLSSEEREQILAMSHDLPALWHAATTSPEDRQSIATKWSVFTLSFAIVSPSVSQHH